MYLIPEEQGAELKKQTMKAFVYFIFLFLLNHPSSVLPVSVLSSSKSIHIPSCWFDTVLKSALVCSRSCVERLGLSSIKIQQMAQAEMRKSHTGVCTCVFQRCRFLFKSHFSCQRHLIQFHNGIELFFQSPTLPSPHCFSLSSISVPCSLISRDWCAPNSPRFPLLPSALPSALSPSLLGSSDTRSSVWLLGASPFLSPKDKETSNVMICITWQVPNNTSETGTPHWNTKKWHCIL